MAKVNLYICDRCGEENKSHKDWVNVNLPTGKDGAMQTWELCPTCAKVHMELVKGHQGELRAFVGGRSQKEQPQQYSEQQQHLREMQRYMEDMRRKQPTSIIPIDKEWGTW